MKTENHCAAALSKREPPALNEVREDLVDTVPEMPQRQASTGNQGACLVHVYPTCPGKGHRFLLGNNSVIVGRDKECGLRIDDPSVSRRHAQIMPGAAGYYVIDLQSTNGTFINDRPASMSRLGKGDVLRIGSRIFRFLAGDDIEVQYQDELYRLATIDGLTNLHNRRFLMEHLERELWRAANYRRPLSLLWLGTGLFSTIVERYGPLIGDNVLRKLAGCVGEKLQSGELFARLGGEEFVVVMPETPREQALKTAEQIRRTVEEHPFTYEDQVLPVTLSLGVATTTGDASLTTESLIQQARREGRTATPALALAPR